MKSALLIRMWLVMCLMGLLAIGCAGTAQQESTGEYVDDTVITSKVKAALAGDPSVDALDVNVETFKGRVQLNGFVNSEQEAQQAVQVARRVEGVRSVQNNLTVK